MHILRSCLFLVLSSALGVVAAKEKEPPHLIVMLVDDAGFADVGFNGGWNDTPSSPTPTMDRLAKDEGLTLDRFYVQPICTPTRAALLTGRYAWRVGFHEVNVLGTGDADCLGRIVDERENNTETLHYVPFEEKSTLGTMKILPEFLASEGYRTHAVGKWHLGFSSTQCYPENRGFDSHFGPLNGISDHYAHINLPGCFAFRPELPCPANPNIPVQGYDLRDTTEPDGIFRIEEISSDTYSTNIFSSRVVRIVEEHDTDKTLFIYYAPTAPHNALQADEQDLESEECSSLPDSERKYICAMMKGLDRSVGDIEAALKEKGMWEDTIFWFMSDNGGVLDFGQDNGDWREGKGSYLDGGIRSAAFLAGGRIKGNVELDQQSFIDVTDVTPTLLGAAGLVVHKEHYEFDGQDLSKNLKLRHKRFNHGSSSSSDSSSGNEYYAEIPGRDIVVTTVRHVQLFLPLFGIDYDFTTGTIISKIDGRYYKFSITPQRPVAPGIQVRGSEEFLFDLVEDPTESENLVEAFPAIAQELKSRMLDATNDAPFFKVASRSVLNAPSPLQAFPPFRGCVVALDDPVRDDDTFTCLDNLVQLTDAKSVDTTFPLQGFGVGTLCLDDNVVGFPPTSCE